MAKYKTEDFSLNGKFSLYCWDSNYNPNANIENGLANCTTMAIALSYVNNLPYPVTRIASAGNWHLNLTNGWTYGEYGKTEIKAGDIIQWKDHVATVLYFTDGEPMLGCSWYTGIHGKSVYNGKYDTRNFKTLKELNDFMFNNYPYRMYHECSLYEESNRVGSQPLYILKSPSVVKSVNRDSSVNQIEVLTSEQNVRDKDLNIVGIAEKGYYNVLSSFKSNYTWCEVEDNKYIAQVDGRVVYLPKDDIEELKKENQRLKAILKQIGELVND